MHLLKKSHKPKVESGNGRTGWRTEPNSKYTVEPDGGNLLVIVDLPVCVCGHGGGGECPICVYLQI